jgi:hypothetical protein
MQLAEEAAVEDALQSAMGKNGEIDEEAAVLEVAKVSPRRALELKGEFDAQKTKKAEAELKWRQLSSQERAAHLKNYREKIDLLGSQAKGVLSMPEDKRDTAYYRMREEVFNALGEELPSMRDDDTLKRLVAGSASYDDKAEQESVAKERLLEFQAALPGFNELIAGATKDRAKQALLTSKILEKFADVPEAREFAFKGIKPEQEKAPSPSVIETREQHDIDNVFKASRDFQDDPVTKAMDTIIRPVETAARQWDEYKKNPSAAKRQFVEQNLIVAFAKIADPSSVVMPGEFKRTVLGQPWLREIYNKLKAGTAIGGLGLDEGQLQVIHDYIQLSKDEAIKQARPGYELMKERIQDFNPRAVARETKRWKHIFDEKPRSNIKLNPAFKGKTDAELQAELDELNKAP